MNVKVDRSIVDDLIASMARLEQLSCELEETISAKRDAMIHADVRAMARLATSEAEAVASIEHQEQLRLILMERAVQDHGISRAAARKMTVSQFAALLHESERKRFLAAAERLKQRVEAASRRNRGVAALAGNVVQMMKDVWASAMQIDAAEREFARGGGESGYGSGRLLEVTG